MDSSSLLLLSLVFMQFVSAADQNNMTIKAEPGDNVILTCEDPEQGKIKIAEWKRTDLGSSDYVLLYKDEKINPGAQHPSYRDRVDLLLNQLRKGDVSLILKNTKTNDSGTYECLIDTEKHVKKLISTINLVVAPRPPDLLPVWATVLLVLLVLALVAAAGLVLYFWFRWSPVPEQKEEEPGKKFVLLPFKVPRRLWFCKYRLSVAKVEWKDGDNRKVHVYQNGSDQPGEQNQRYKDRTKMDKNLLKNGDLSLTLSWPTEGDGGTFTCSVSNKDRDVLMEKQFWLKVKDSKVEVEPGVESVLLPCRTTEDLDGDTKVVWMDRYNRKVHMYQYGSNQPGLQDQFYRTRTRMDGHLLKTKDLSLTLSWPTYRDENTYTCRVYNRKGDVLMMKQVNLWVKVKEQVVVEPGVESVLLPWTITEDLDGDVKVEWRDRDNRKVHVYQNGSDQPGEQDQFYRTRTRMEENLLKTKDLSLTLRRPTDGDRGIYTCRVSNRAGVILMKQIDLKVKAGTVQVQPEDTRTRIISIDPTPLLADQSV